MLNRFVKIIEQVDPEQQQEASSLENSSHQQHETQNEQYETVQSTTTIQMDYQQENQEEITDYDPSDPFVAEYNHRASPSVKIQNATNNIDDNNDHSNKTSISSFPSPLPPITPSYQQQQQQQLLNASSHYMAYLNSSGSFDLSSAVASSDVKALLERIAALESAIVQANYERQVLQVKLEQDPKPHQTSKNFPTSFNGNHNHDEFYEESLKQLRQSLVEQIEKNDALARDFQGRIVQLEYDLIVAQRKNETAKQQVQQEPEKNDEVLLVVAESSVKIEISSEDDACSPSLATSKEFQQLQKNHENKITHLEAKLLDAQRKADLMQKKAADALERSAARENAMKNDLELHQRELEEARKRLTEAQRPLDRQLEDQLRSVPVFERIHQTPWGAFVTNLAGTVDRLGVQSGRFFAHHAVIRFFFVLYVICLHIYIFHLFFAVLHHLDHTAGGDVHEHLRMNAERHGHAVSPNSP